MTRERFSISAEAVRKRLQRGTLDGTRTPDGTWLVNLSSEPVSGRPQDTASAALTVELRDQIADLRRRLDKAEAARNKDREALENLADKYARDLADLTVQNQADMIRAIRALGSELAAPLIEQQTNATSEVSPKPRGRFGRLFDRSR